MNSSELTDTFGRVHTYLRISVTDRCNLRCTYCMPEHGNAWTPPPDVLTAQEILRLSSIFVGMGIRKIRLTGGEPLTRPAIADIAAQIHALPGLECLAITTNGIGLKKWALPLRQAGVESVTVSLDTLKKDRFISITRRDRFDDVLDGIEEAANVGFRALKLNIVVMKGVNDDELMDFVSWGRNRLIDLRFIEYMPFPDNRWSRAGLMPYEEMRRQISSAYRLIPLQCDPSSVGKSFALAGHAATVSFVTSMTENFCGGCSRLRLTADGNIKACLFGNEERSLRNVMRQGGSDDDVRAEIVAAVRSKAASHAPMEELAVSTNRAMIAIGG